jgi:hypothetical protein
MQRLNWVRFKTVGGCGRNRGGGGVGGGWNLTALAWRCGAGASGTGVGGELRGTPTHFPIQKTGNCKIRLHAPGACFIHLFNESSQFSATMIRSLLSPQTTLASLALPPRISQIQNRKILCQVVGVDIVKVMVRVAPSQPCAWLVMVSPISLLHFI